MHEKLLQWIDFNKVMLNDSGIVTEEIVASPFDIDEPCARIDQSTKECIGRICAWKNGTIDIEVIEILTEKRIMIAHYENQSEIDCFVKPYIRVMTKNS